MNGEHVGTLAVDERRVRVHDDQRRNVVQLALRHPREQLKHAETVTVELNKP